MSLAREPYTTRDPQPTGRPARPARTDLPDASLSRAVRARDEMLAMVAHDLRNPLNVIAMAAAMTLETSSVRDEETARRMEAILRASSQMDRLIADLLDAAALDAGSLSLDRRAEPVRALLEEARGWFAERARTDSITLLCMVEDGPPVLADRRRIVQVLVNLLENAMRVTAPGGRILLHATPCDGGVRFTVSDSGPGIAPEDLPHVFARFWRARDAAHGSAGLGLAIARGIVHAHGGRMWVESEPGAGAIFGFTIPAAARVADAPAAAPGQPAAGPAEAPGSCVPAALPGAVSQRARAGCNWLARPD